MFLFTSKKLCHMETPLGNVFRSFMLINNELRRNDGKRIMMQRSIWGFSKIFNLIIGV